MICISLLVLSREKNTSFAFYSFFVLPFDIDDVCRLERAVLYACTFFISCCVLFVIHFYCPLAYVMLRFNIFKVNDLKRYRNFFKICLFAMEATRIYLYFSSISYNYRYKYDFHWLQLEENTFQIPLEPMFKLNKLLTVIKPVAIDIIADLPEENGVDDVSENQKEGGFGKIKHFFLLYKISR